MKAMSAAMPAVLAAAMQFGPGAASAQGACLFEGSVTHQGKRVETRDCWQNHGAPRDHFEHACREIVNVSREVASAPALGVRLNETRLTFPAACPMPAQGRCERAFDQPITVFYYRRDEKPAEMKQACDLIGGKWRAG
jgi:hypothetical protein